ncbi:MAG: hypothetical protein F6J93_31190 [Oscillatoria sp. SIO1A7]|nr:hypothetical protein [Oscillatoria sp. SIO1A7]
MPNSPHSQFPMKDVENKIQHMMSVLSDRLDLLSDDNLEFIRATLEPLYQDVRVFQAIEEAENNFNPGDTLTRDEAIEYLLYM